MDKNSKTIISACYITNIICSATSCVSPLLFLTLKTMYNISYSLLGLLIVIGFLTQLFIDLIFTFFSKKFNINLCVNSISSWIDYVWINTMDFTAS